jgi:hypothetical protein
MATPFDRFEAEYRDGGLDSALDALDLRAVAEARTYGLSQTGTVAMLASELAGMELGGECGLDAIHERAMELIPDLTALMLRGGVLDGGRCCCDEA